MSDFSTPRSIYRIVSTPNVESLPAQDKWCTFHFLFSLERIGPSIIVQIPSCRKTRFLVGQCSQNLRLAMSALCKMPDHMCHQQIKATCPLRQSIPIAAGEIPNRFK